MGFLSSLFGKKQAQSSSSTTPLDPANAKEILSRRIDEIYLHYQKIASAPIAWRMKEKFASSAARQGAGVAVIDASGSSAITHELSAKEIKTIEKIGVQAFQESIRREKDRLEGDLTKYINDNAQHAALALLQISGDVCIRTKDVKDLALTYFVKGMGKSAIPYAVDGLQDPNADVRYQTVHALRTIGCATATSALVACLKDRDKDVRCLAATTLGEIGDGSAAEALKAAQQSDSDSDVRNAAEKSLASLLKRIGRS
jgi:hypothetical protein